MRPGSPRPNHRARGPTSARSAARRGISGLCWRRWRSGRKGMDAVIIARPHSIGALRVPDGVEILSNIPFGRTWRIAADSLGVLVPLRDEETCCGHLTLVCAKLLGIPLVTSFSRGTAEYVEDREAVLVTPPRDVGALVRAIERLADDQPHLRVAAEAAVPAETEFHDRTKWADYLAEFILSH